MKAKSLPERLLIGRQIAAVTTAFMIPVSTSGQAVSMFVLLVALTAKREGHPQRPCRLVYFCCY